jgi:hypothetical protein
LHQLLTLEISTLKLKQQPLKNRKKGSDARSKEQIEFTQWACEFAKCVSPNKFDYDTKETG